MTSVRYRQNYFTDHEEYGRVEAGMDRQAELRPTESATIKGDENTIKQALAELERLGASDERKKDFEAEFERAEPGDWLDVRPGYRIQRLIDWTDAKFKPSLTDPITPLHVPVGISYLYLGAAMNREKAAADAYCAANRHGTNLVEPRHLLRAKTERDGVLVVFHVFQDLCWPVRFPGVALAGEQTLYWIDLEQSTEWWATKLSGQPGPPN